MTWQVTIFVFANEFTTFDIKWNIKKSFILVNNKTGINVSYYIIK